MHLTIKKLKTQSELWYIATGYISDPDSAEQRKPLIGYGTSHYLAICNALQLLASK